jgi:ACS family tartrate transporter-like MFS transporter
MKTETAASRIDLLAEEAEAALSKVRKRLLPFLFALYIVAYLDRINVGFAALQMNREIGISQLAFGFGSGIFFLGYFLFEIPSNLILRRVGARRWIARIMVSWGVAASATMLVRGPSSFYAMRFILGVAEAGFFPGIIYYLTLWFPERERARAIALFMTASALAGVIAGPVSGLLLTLHGLGGLSGWQWMFLLEGLPAIVMGVAVWFYLPDCPGDALWLTALERKAIVALLEQDDAARRNPHASLSRAIRSARVWLLTLFYFLFAFGLYGINFWLPQILKSFGDMSVVAIGFVAAAYARNPAVELACIALASAGTSSCVGPFWAIPASILADAGAAGGIELINSVGNLGGFAGPYVAGFIVERTHNFSAALITMGLALALAAALTRLIHPPD